MADSPRTTTRKTWLWLIIIAAVVLIAVVGWSMTHRGEDIGGSIAMDSADMADTAPTDTAPTSGPSQPR